MTVLLRLRDALDAADTARFSEAEFGPVAPCVPSMGPAHNQTACAERVEAIVGAEFGDAPKAVAVGSMRIARAQINSNYISWLSS